MVISRYSLFLKFCMHLNFEFLRQNSKLKCMQKFWTINCTLRLAAPLVPFIYITGYLNVRKISETIDFWTFVGPLVFSDPRFFWAGVIWKMISKCPQQSSIHCSLILMVQFFGSLVICYSLPLQAWLFNDGESPKSKHPILIQCRNIMMPRNAWQNFHWSEKLSNLWWITDSVGKGFGATLTAMSSSRQN